MSKIYNRAFKAGVAFNIVIFIVLSLISYVVAYREYHDPARLIRFSGEEIRWGFPIDWSYGLGVPVGFVLNIFIVSFFSFIVGFIFRFVSDKLSEQ